MNNNNETQTAEPNGHGLLVELRYAGDLRHGDVFVWRTDFAFIATPESNTVRCVRTLDRHPSTPGWCSVVWSYGTVAAGGNYTTHAHDTRVVAVVTLDPTYTGNQKAWS